MAKESPFFRRISPTSTSRKVHPQLFGQKLAHENQIPPQKHVALMIIGGGLGVGNDQPSPLGHGVGNEAGHGPHGEGRPQNKEEIGFFQLALGLREGRGEGLTKKDHIRLH